MSSSTPWITSRTASRSSSSAVSLPIAVAVPTRVVSSGTPARSASVDEIGGGSSPPVISTHGTAVANDCASAWRRAAGSSPSR